MKKLLIVMAITAALLGCASTQPTTETVGAPPEQVMDAIASAAVSEGWTIEAQTSSVISVRDPMPGTSMMVGNVSQLYQARVTPTGDGGSQVVLNVYRQSQGAGQIPQGHHTHDKFWEMVRPYL